MTEATLKHSPLPWEFSDGSIWAISPWNARVRIATIHRHSPMNGIDSDANGRLMKAAPKLLAALQGMLEMYGPRGGEIVWDGPAEEARVAIAEATGKEAA